MTLPLSLGSRTILVSEVMHAGVINCPPQTPLREIAGLMAEHSAHCVVLDGLAHSRNGTERLVWGLVSDVDLMRAAGSGRLDSESAEIATGKILTIDLEEDIEHAAQIMGENGCSHLIVLADTGQPVGVISSLDGARGIAWGPRT